MVFKTGDWIYYDNADILYCFGNLLEWLRQPPSWFGVHSTVKWMFTLGLLTIPAMPVGVLLDFLFGGHNHGKQKPMRKPIGLLSLLVAFAFTTGCTTTSTSRQWNGRVGPNGKPVYVKSHTNIGVNFGIFIPLLGATALPKQINGLTKDIETEKGDVVRMIESSTENYWYGFPPFTWILTPVITTVTADYEPSPDVLAKDLAEQEKKKAAKQKK